MESHTGPRPAYNPRDALADVAAARSSVADRLITPWWYHPALGVILAALVLVGALDLHNAVRVHVAVACAASIGLLVSAYQRVTGLWVDIRNLGPVSSRWWFAYLAMVVVVVGISLVPSFTDRGLPGWTTALLVVVILVGTIVLGRGMDAAMRAEIRSGAAPTPRAKR